MRNGRGPGALRFTVITATYNRAHLLPDLYRSLARQSYGPPEWVVVDDGSTDRTGDVVDELSREGSVPVRYIRQVNAGMVAALNTALAALPESDFTVKVDDDDYLGPDALEHVVRIWGELSPEERLDICCIAGLYTHEDGRVVGDRFPRDYLISDYLRCRLEGGVSGDKCEVYRTLLLKQFRYPLLGDERRMPTSYIDLKMGQLYRTLYVNVPFGVQRNQEEGLTRQSVRIRIRSPHTSAFYYNELLAQPIRSPRVFLRAALNYLRFALHTGASLRRILGAANRQGLLVLLPIAYLMVLVDGVRHES